MRDFLKTFHGADCFVPRAVVEVSSIILQYVSYKSTCCTISKTFSMNSLQYKRDRFFSETID